MVSMPGALTPTEIVAAHGAGADIVKLFPAGTLGVDYIKAVRGPLGYIDMSAVGGVKPKMWSSSSMRASAASAWVVSSCWLPT